MLFIHLLAGTPVLKLADLDEHANIIESFDGTFLWANEMGIVTTFYDWLRNSRGTLVGARIYPFDLGIDFFIETAAALEYCRVVEGSLEIYFGAERQNDPGQSALLDIIPCSLWRSSNDPSRFACAIPTQYLSAEEVERLASGK
jgi:hypothetical protein